MKTRQYVIIISFFFVTAFLSAYSLLGNFDQMDQNSNEANVQTAKSENDESYFKGIDYFLIDKGRPFIQLEASDLTLSKQNTVVVSFNPVGVIHRFDEKGVEEDPINFNSKQSQMTMENKELLLQDEVGIHMTNSELKSNRVTIFNNGKHLEARGSVRTTSFDPKTNDQILINSDFALYRPKEQFFEYQKNVTGEIQRRRKYEESVKFTTDLLTLSGPQSLVEMKGNVTLNKGNLDASSNQGTVFLENYNKKLKYYSLSDDVRLQETLEADGKKMVRKGFAEKLEGLISEKKIILTGLPKVFQEKDVIKGNRIIIRENVETVEVDDANTNITLEKDKEEKI